MASIESKTAAVAKFSEQYREKTLDEPDLQPKDVDSALDSAALRFFLMNIFASARSEALSAEYREQSEAVLRNHEAEILERWSGSGGISDETLAQALADAGVGNQHDRQMMIDVVDFLGSLTQYDHNIIEYTTQRIQDGEIEAVYRRLTDIHNVGPKKATLYLRDIVTAAELEAYIEGDDYRYVFPVDTWVHQVGRKIGIFDTDSPNWAVNSTEIVEHCDDSVSSIEFNQGAWYLGANAFEIVIDNLERIEADPS